MHLRHPFFLSVLCQAMCDHNRCVTDWDLTFLMTFCWRCSKQTSKRGRKHLYPHYARRVHCPQICIQRMIILSFVLIFILDFLSMDYGFRMYTKIAVVTSTKTYSWEWGIESSFLLSSANCSTNTTCTTAYVGLMIENVNFLYALRIFFVYCL